MKRKSAPSDAAAVAAESWSMYAPRGPTPASVGKWAAFGFKTTMTSFGGYSGKSEWPVTSEVLDTDRGEERFVQVAKTDTWVFKSVAGASAEKGSLRRVKITSDLIKQVNSAIVASDGNTTDAAAAVPAASGEKPASRDRFDDLDTLDSQAAVETPKKSKKPRLAESLNRVVVLKQPAICPLSKVGAASEEKVEVRCLRKHSQQLWISEESAPWLMGYMATEYALGGVVEHPGNPGADEEEDEEGDGAEGGEDGAAVAEPAITWDWESGDGYIANVNGKKLRCQVSTFTEAKWDKMRAIRNYSSTFAQASPAELAQACYDYLENYLETNA